MEGALPEGVGEDGDGGAGGHIFGEGELAAEAGGDAEDAEVAGGDALLLDVLGDVVGGEVGAVGTGIGGDV